MLVDKPRLRKCPLRNRGGSAPGKHCCGPVSSRQALGRCQDHSLRPGPDGNTRHTAPGIGGNRPGVSEVHPLRREELRAVSRERDEPSPCLPLARASMFLEMISPTACSQVGMPRWETLGLLAGLFA